ncbi:MAG: outer membrane protein assembly factor BamC [Methylophilaceae bacterium]|nr:outer membrane protein assembly factor BamC [Methylophilaceae bacterium]
MDFTAFRTTCVTLLALLTLTGCDTMPFIDDTSDYKGASRGRPLEVPPDLTSISTSDTYSIPGTATYSAYLQDQEKPGEPEKILPEAESVRYERAGSQRWLVVKAPPEKIWPVVREFWTDLGFAVRVENPQTGVMETEWVDATTLTTKDEKGNYLDKFQGWLDKLSSLKNRQKFRTRIDRGIEEGTTEIYLSHRSISDVTDDGKERIRTTVGTVETGYRFEGKERTKTQDERAIAEDIDAELLRRLMVKLGIAEKQSHAIIANPVQEKRATLNKAADGTATLELKDPFDRAWRRVGLALDRIGFLVEDRNRSQGLFFVRYSDIEEESSGNEKGLLDRLKFWGDDDKKESAKPEAKDKGVMSRLKFWESDKEKAAAIQYRIKLERTGEGTHILVVDKDNKRDRSPTANRILAMLYEQLK